MTPVALIIGGLGVALVYSAITGQPFLDTLRETFTKPASQHTRPDTRPLELADAESDGAGKGIIPTMPKGDPPTGANAPPVSLGGSVPGSGGNPCRALPVPTALVSIGQGGHKLAAAAAASLARAATAAGGPIRVTDSFRSYDQQADCHARKPTICAAPGGSCHEKGLAIDVVDMRNQRVIDALTAEGWVRFDPTREPWHWSYQVRG